MISVGTGDGLSVWGDRANEYLSIVEFPGAIADKILNSGNHRVKA